MLVTTLYLSRVVKSNNFYINRRCYYCQIRIDFFLFYLEIKSLKQKKLPPNDNEGVVCFCYKFDDLYLF